MDTALGFQSGGQTNKPFHRPPNGENVILAFSSELESSIAINRFVLGLFTRR